MIYQDSPKGRYIPEEDDTYNFKFQFDFAYPFKRMISAYLEKFHLETRYTLTSLPRVRQLDDNRVEFLRRQDQSIIDQTPDQYERIVLDRSKKVMTVFVLDQGQKVIERAEYSPLSAKETQMNLYVEQYLLPKSDKILNVQRNLEWLLRSIKWNEWEREAESR